MGLDVASSKRRGGVWGEVNRLSPPPLSLAEISESVDRTDSR